MTELNGQTHAPAPSATEPAGPTGSLPAALAVIEEITRRLRAEQERCMSLAVQCAVLTEENKRLRSLVESKSESVPLLPEKSNKRRGAQ